jgi:hypothetical protein
MDLGAVYYFIMLFIALALVVILVANNLKRYLFDRRDMAGVKIFEKLKKTLG